jgi:hypothetical protein
VQQLQDRLRGDLGSEGESLMATYKVELDKGERTHYVLELKSGFGKERYPHTMLIYSYPAGDIDTRMKDAHMMFGALYDLFQTHDDLKDGDIFETEFGTYHCEGVHVVADFVLGPVPEYMTRQHNCEW